MVRQEYCLDLKEKERDPTIPGTKAWRDMMALKPRYSRR